MARGRITVTDLIRAVLYPDWRQEWLAGAKPRTRPPVGGHPPVYGTVFHELVEDYVRWLSAPASRPATGGLDSPEDLWAALWARSARDRIERLLAGKGNPVESVYRLGQCLKAFCGQLAALRRRTTDFRNWSDVFLTQEFTLERISLPVGAATVIVSGRIDAVRTHPRHGLEIVDYKLSRGGNFKHDLPQLALYARLLRQRKPGLTFHGTLEYYEPDLHEVPVSAQELESIFDEMIAPVVGELAGCRVRPAKPATVPWPAGKNTDILAEKIKACYASFHLEVEVLGRIEAPRFFRYQVRPAEGATVISLADRVEDLQLHLGLDQPLLIDPAQGWVAIDLPKDTPDQVRWRDLTGDPAYLQHPSPLAFPVGLGVDHQALLADLAAAETSHALVAGIPGSGRSGFLRAMIASLLARNLPGTPRLSVIDPGMVTFGPLAGSLFLDQPVVEDTGQAMDLLRSVAAETDERFRLMTGESHGQTDEAPPPARPDRPSRIVVCVEFSDLILGGKEQRKEFETLVARIAAQGRAAGIHLVLATRRPNHRTVTPAIKAHLPLKVCLRVATARDSRTILDQTGGQALLGQGDLLCDLGRGLVRVQGPYLTNEEFTRLIGASSITNIKPKEPR